MRNAFKRILRVFRTAERRKTDFAKAAARFIEANPDTFVLLADADTDLMVGAYKNVMVPVRMKQADGKRMHIVSNALQYSRVEKSVDQFLLIVDSMLVKIAEERDTERSKKLSVGDHEFREVPMKKTMAGVTSPLQPLKTK